MAPSWQWIAVVLLNTMNGPGYVTLPQAGRDAGPAPRPLLGLREGLAQQQAKQPASRLCGAGGGGMLEESPGKRQRRERASEPADVVDLLGCSEDESEMGSCADALPGRAAAGRGV